MFENIFYFSGLLIFIISLFKTINYSKIMNISNWVVKFKKVTGSEPKITDFREQYELGFLSLFSIGSIIEGIWILSGIATINWFIFLTIIIFNIISIYLFREDNIIVRLFGTLFSLSKTILFIFLIINHFHLNIDLYSLIF